MTVPQQQGAVDSIYQLLGQPEPYQNALPRALAQQVVDQWVTAQAAAPVDTALAGAEFGELGATGLVTGGLDAALPTAAALGPETAGASLLAVGAVAVGGALFGQLVAPPAVLTNSLAGAADWRLEASTQATWQENLGGYVRSAGGDCLAAGGWEFAGTQGSTSPNGCGVGVTGDDLFGPFYSDEQCAYNSGSLVCNGNAQRQARSSAVTASPLGYTGYYALEALRTDSHNPRSQGDTTGTLQPANAPYWDASFSICDQQPAPTGSFQQTTLDQGANTCLDGTGHAVSYGGSAYVEAQTAMQSGPLTPQPGAVPGAGTYQGTTYRPTATPVGQTMASPAPTVAQVTAGLQAFFNAPAAGAQGLVGQTVGTLQNAPTALTPESCDWSDYPEQVSLCVTQLQQEGFNNVVVLPESDPTCTSNTYCATTGDPVGTVEGMSSTRSPYTEAGYASVVLPLTATIYVFQEGAVAGGGGGGGASLTMPDCSGLTVPACATGVLAAGFTATPTVVWVDGAQTGTPAGYIVKTNPYQGAVVTVPSQAVVLTGAGLVVPAPTPNEVQTQYALDLQTAGFPTAPIVTTLTPATYDPFLAPGAVVTVAPAPGTIIDPAAAPGLALQLSVNPNPLPQGGTATGGPPAPANAPVPNPFSSPTVDPAGIHFPSIPTPCNVFPFGVPCWIVNQLQALSAGPVAPSFQISTPAMLGGAPITVDLGNVFGFDLSSLMTYARPLLVVLSVAVFMLWLAHRPPPGFSGNESGEQGELF